MNKGKEMKHITESKQINIKIHTIDLAVILFEDIKLIFNEKFPFQYNNL